MAYSWKEREEERGEKGWGRGWQARENLGGRVAPGLWRTEEGTRRCDKMCRGECGLSRLEEWGQRPTADPEGAEATKEKISQEGEKESTAKK